MNRFLQASISRWKNYHVGFKWTWFAMLDLGYTIKAILQINGIVLHQVDKGSLHGSKIPSIFFCLVQAIQLTLSTQ